MTTFADIEAGLLERYKTATSGGGRVELCLRVKGTETWVRLSVAPHGGTSVTVEPRCAPALRKVVPLEIDQIERCAHRLVREVSRALTQVSERRVICFAHYME